MVKKKSKCRHGNPYLSKTLITAANGAVKKNDSFYQARARKLTMQTGSRNKAKVAIANSIARAIYYLISEESIHYKDLGDARVTNPDRQIKNCLKKLTKLGVVVNYHIHTKVCEAKKEITKTIREKKRKG